MDTIFKYTSLAAGSIAKEQGWLHDSERVKRLCYALYETAIKIEPNKCPPAWAKGARNNDN